MKRYRVRLISTGNEELPMVINRWLLWMKPSIHYSLGWGFFFSIFVSIFCRILRWCTRQNVKSTRRREATAEDSRLHIPTFHTSYKKKKRRRRRWWKRRWKSKRKTLLTFIYPDFALKTSRFNHIIIEPIHPQIIDQTLNHLNFKFEKSQWIYSI